jgi:hypothetical protein
MNGAELPCGSILHVEPATRNYANSSSDQRQQQKEQPPPSIESNIKRFCELSDSAIVVESTMIVNENDDNQAATDDTDDLDEFFDSL